MRIVRRYIPLILIGFMLAGCGFQLRGLGNYQMPASLSTMRVTVAGSQAANDPLRLAMEDALRVQAGVAIVQTADASTLVITHENTDVQTLSVDASGKVAEYLLRYEIGFAVADAAGGEMTPPQTLRLQRDYRFNPLNVLAKEQEEANLKRELRRDALSQIVRRLARLKPAPSKPQDAKDAGQS
jgi:LPS-assembly lipoprotein